MNKSLNTVLLLLVVSLMGAVGFLGYRVAELNQLYVKSQNDKLAQAISVDTVNKQLELFQSDLADQGALLEQSSLNITKLTKEFEDFATLKYMPAPQFAIDETAFATKPGESGDTVVADLTAYNLWLKQNELLLDAIAKKILPLDYDRVSSHVVIKELTKGSLFYQIGLRQGDKIATVDTKIINKGNELRDVLIAPKDKQIVILRDGKKLTLTVQYRPKEGDQLALDATKQQFDKTLPKPTPAVKEDKLQGVEVVDIGADNVKQ